MTRKLIRVAAFTALVVFGCWAAYALISNVFRSYDDEGYMLLSFRNFSAGKPLYDQVFTQYGPFFFLMQQGAYSLLHEPLTHDGGRIVTLAYWLASASLGSWIVFRYSRDLVLSGIAFCAICACESGLASEPGHPQQVVILLLMMAALASNFVFERIFREPALFLLGAIGAALALTKINVGVFYLLALASSLLTFFAKPASRRLGWIFGTFLYLLAPLALMHRHWWDGFGPLSVLLSAGLAVLALTSMSFDAVPPLPGRALAIPSAGVLLTGISIITATLATGVTPRGLLQGAFTSALHHGDAFTGDFFLSPGARLLWLIGAVFVATRLVRPRIFDTPAANAWVKAIAGCSSLILLVLSPNAGVVLATLLFPVALWPTRSDSSHRFPLFFLSHVALLQMLQIYPVGGSQAGVAATIAVPWSLILLADALREFQSAHPRIATLAVRGLSQIPLLLALLIAPVVLRAVHKQLGDMPKVPSDLPGSALIHMEPGNAAAYRWLTLNLPRHCDTLFSMPGMGSLNIWSGVPAPSSQFMTAWMSGFSNAQQQSIIEGLRSHSHPCVVYNPELVKFWLQGKTPTDNALQNFISANFHIAAKTGAYEVLVSNSNPADWNRSSVQNEPRKRNFSRESECCRTVFSAENSPESLAHQD